MYKLFIFTEEKCSINFNRWQGGMPNKVNVCAVYTSELKEDI